ASDAQIMFLVLNASGLTIIPISIMADRAMLGSTNPTSIFIPTLIATLFSTFIGLLYISLRQRIKLHHPVLLGFILGMTGLIALVIWYFSGLTPEQLQTQSSISAAIIILTTLVSFISLGLKNKVPIFEAFVDGAKEGFGI